LKIEKTFLFCFTSLILTPLCHKTTTPSLNTGIQAITCCVGLVIAQVVGWAKPDPTTKWRQLREHLPIATLGRYFCHFRDERITSRGDLGDPEGNEMESEEMKEGSPKGHDRECEKA
jgi:hypothetical protein